MSQELPHDLNMIALEIAQTAPAQVGDSIEKLRIRIAEALLAERERCLSLADLVSRTPDPGDYGDDRYYAGQEILAAIQSGKNATPETISDIRSSKAS